MAFLGSIGEFVNNWKRPLIGIGAGALGGIGVGAAGKALGASGMLANPATLGIIGGLAGGAAGYSAKQRAAQKELAAKELERQNNDRANAGGRLDDILAPYLPTPGGDGLRSPGDPTSTYTPPVPTGSPVAPVAPVSPVASQPVDAGLNIPVINPGMGNLNTGGAAGNDVKSILDEAERAKQAQLDLLNSQAGMKEKTRAELAKILNDQMERQFSDQMPAYLEDLNTRGLLRSSALGDRLATERSKMAAGVNEQLALQGITDQYGGIDALTGVSDQYLKARQSGLSRQFSLEDWARQMQASKELGSAVAPVTPYAGTGKGGMQDLQTGMSVAGLGKTAASAGR
jgi:hypothetical protein